MSCQAASITGSAPTAATGRDLKERAWVWWPRPAVASAEYQLPLLAKIAVVEVAVVLVLGLPAVAAVTGVAAPFLAMILALHLTCVFAAGAAVRYWQQRPWVRALHLPFVLTYNLALTLAVVVHSGDPRTPWWYAYVMYAGISGAVQELEPARGLLVVFGVVPALAVPGFVAAGVPLQNAVASAALAGGMGVLAYFLPAASSLRWRQLRAQQAQELEAARSKAHELERQALARELHDAVGSHLAIVALYGDLLAEQRGNAQELAEVSRQLRESAQQGLTELRTVLNALAPESGTFDSVASHARHLADRATAAGVAAQLELDGPPEQMLPALPRLTAVRVLQEAVTNAVRHSQSAELKVAVALQGAALIVEVVDNGIGFHPETPGGGRGLAGMRQRVLAAGGHFRLVSQPAHGCQVRAHIPLQVADVPA